MVFQIVDKGYTPGSICDLIRYKILFAPGKSKQGHFAVKGVEGYHYFCTNNDKVLIQRDEYEKI